jgi:O-antigen ligase
VVSAGVLVLAALVLRLAVRWQRAKGRALRVVDTMVVTTFAAMLFQMTPLPVGIVAVLSPARESFVSSTSLTPSHVSFAPLSLSVPATAHAALTFAAIAMTYWTARSLFARGGVRTFSMMMAWGAIAFSILAFAQHGAETPLVYGFWHPRDPGARPLGPFINRNHFGTWGIMAWCLCLGYLRWREHKPENPTLRARVVSVLDARGIVLGLAVVLLAAVIALGASRSALVALACAGGSFAFFASSVRRGGRRPLSLLLLGAVVAATLAYGEPERLLMRLDETRDQGFAKRTEIWRDAISATRDYMLTGVGAGAFADAMRIYQTTPRTYYHNEAHNQYVQILAEGGLLMTVPALIAAVAFLIGVRDRLARPSDPLRWMRVASASALVGVAVQSLWETGLTLPANGMFAAALAGLLVHESDTSGESRRLQELC